MDIEELEAMEVLVVHQAESARMEKERLPNLCREHKLLLAKVLRRALPELAEKGLDGREGGSLLVGRRETAAVMVVNQVKSLPSCLLDFRERGVAIRGQRRA